MYSVLHWIRDSNFCLHSVYFLYAAPLTPVRLYMPSGEILTRYTCTLQKVFRINTRLLNGIQFASTLISSTTAWLYHVVVQIWRCKTATCRAQPSLLFPMFWAKIRDTLNTNHIACPSIMHSSVRYGTISALICQIKRTRFCLKRQKCEHFHWEELD